MSGDNPIPPDQRYIGFPAEEPGLFDYYGWEWLEDRHAWDDVGEPGWEPLIVELVPVEQADRWRAIEAAARAFVQWDYLSGDQHRADLLVVLIGTVAGVAPSTQEPTT